MVLHEDKKECRRQQVPFFLEIIIGNKKDKICHGHNHEPYEGQLGQKRHRVKLFSFEDYARNRQSEQNPYYVLDILCHVICYNIVIAHFAVGATR